MIRHIKNIFSTNKPQRLLNTDLSGIQYLGQNGITSSCLKAITGIINNGQQIKKSCLITYGSMHAFVLSNEHDEFTAIKAGFSSGYSGEGPRGLATALILLERHGAEIDEYQVDSLFMERLECSCLLKRDIYFLQKKSHARPQQWHEYAHNQGRDIPESTKRLSSHYPLSIPFAIIDERIIDLAVSFCGNEDSSIISAYRRLEDIIRERTGLSGEGTRLFAKAFLTEDCPLRWDVLDDAEGKGRANLFNAVYMAFRNARVHRETECSAEAMTRELLLINELYKLEAEAFTESELKTKREDDASIRESLRM